MREQPDAIELLQAVIDYLRQDAMPALQGLTAFHARVAASLLEIVQRELRLGPQADAAELARLRGLLGSDGVPDELNRELCARIAAGGSALDRAQLVDHLFASTMDKLAVDQPEYSTYRRLTQAAGKGT